MQSKKNIPHRKISIGNTEFYISSLIVFIFLVFYLFRIVNIQRELMYDGWVAGDWLINYAGGFVRRGGIGEIIRIIGDLTSLSSIYILFYFKILLYILIVLSLIYICIINKIGIIEVILLVSPWGLMFDLNYVGGSGRKEIILILAFLLFIIFEKIVSNTDKRMYFKTLFIYSLVSFPALVLLHEGTFFFLHFFIFYIGLKNRFDKKLLKLFVVPYIMAIICLAIAFVHIGDISNSIAICSSLNLTLNDGLCGGAIASLYGYTFKVYSGFYKTYIPILFLSYIPLICYGCSVLSSVKHSVFIAYSILALLLTIPMYYLGSDWGRWIHITSILLFLSILGSKEKYLVQFKDMSAIVIFFIIITPFIYVFNWRIPHVVDPDATTIWRSQDFSGWISTFF